MAHTESRFSAVYLIVTGVPALTEVGVLVNPRLADCAAAKLARADAPSARVLKKCIFPDGTFLRVAFECD